MTVQSGVTTQEPAGQKLRAVHLNPIALNGAVITDGSPPILTSLGAGTPASKEVEAGLEITGWLLDDGDELYHELDVKTHLAVADLDKDLWLELVFTSLKSTAHGAIDFKAFAKGMAAGATLTDYLVSPDSSIVYPAQSVATTLKLCKASMPLNAAGVFKDDEILGVVIELDDKGDGAADETVLLFSRLWYTPEICDPYGRQLST
jgi:hypothetical protein